MSKIFDREWTAARLDPSYEATMAIAMERDADPVRPDPPSWSDQVLHPMGMQLLQVLAPRIFVDGHVASLREESRSIADRRAKILARL